MAYQMWQTKDYIVQNFPPEPRPDGLPLREGGRFVPRKYTSNEDFSHALSPQQYRQQYAQSFESGSVVEQMPLNKIGTGHRRIDISAVGDNGGSGSTKSGRKESGKSKLQIVLRVVGCPCCLVT
jgi:hypothetical protein